LAAAASLAFVLSGIALATADPGTRTQDLASVAPTLVTRVANAAPPRMGRPLGTQPDEGALTQEISGRLTAQRTNSRATSAAGATTATCPDPDGAGTLYYVTTAELAGTAVVVRVYEAADASLRLVVLKPTSCEILVDRPL
jgi:hypothetical protein